MRGGKRAGWRTSPYDGKLLLHFASNVGILLPAETLLAMLLTEMLLEIMLLSIRRYKPNPRPGFDAGSHRRP